MPHDFTLQTHPRRSANRWPSLNPEKWPEGLKSGAQSTARGLGLRCNDVVIGDAALPLPFKGRFRSPPVRPGLLIGVVWPHGPRPCAAPRCVER